MLLKKLVAAGIGSRPVVFVTHRLINLISLSFYVFGLRVLVQELS